MGIKSPVIRLKSVNKLADMTLAIQQLQDGRESLINGINNSRKEVTVLKKTVRELRLAVNRISNTLR